MEHIITTANFQKEVLESDMPVLLDFYADWCGPCKMMGPVVEELAKEYDSKIKVGKMAFGILLIREEVLLDM